MMITFQGQIKTVGSHQALISKVADRVQRRCSRIGFRRRRGCALSQREARLQTDTASQGHACALCIQKQWDPGRLGDPRQTLWIIHFHSLAQTAPRRPLASLCWRLKLSGYHKHTFPLKPNPSWTKDWTKVEGRFSSGCCWTEAKYLSGYSLLLTTKLATEYSHQPKKKSIPSKDLHVSAEVVE